MKRTHRRTDAVSDHFPEILEGVNLRNAPANELGVVYLFAELAKRWRVRVDDIRSGYPDCIAYQRVRGEEKRIRIEFEFRSRNFRQHAHDPRKCDWIVCWEHNWPDAPARLQVVELRREFGLGFNVWLLPNSPSRDSRFASESRLNWSVPSLANKGDLALIYITTPTKAIKYICRIDERPKRQAARWKPGMDYFAQLAVVARLSSPVFFEDLKGHRILSTSPFVRGQMRIRYNAMEYWPHLYRLIAGRDSGARKALRRYAPERLG